MRNKIILALLSIGAAIAVTSCSTSKPTTIIPRAVSTMNVAPLSSLNLDRKEYQIGKTITAVATITYTETNGGNKRKIVSEDGDFMLNYSFDEKTGWSCKYSGILQLGYFGSDYINQEPTNIMQPEEVVRRLAIYRAMSIARSEGADALVEPTVSTNIEQNGKDVIFQSVVTAKVFTIKAN